ncbi:RelA/SpoT family protein, partial [Actinocrinis sp.]|uniref:RelA/SpoT family protein n=1 Tax=Actinocrinis sp. TaxID=1920516 RepID=UPI0039C8926C
MGQGGSRLTTTPEAAVRAERDGRSAPAPSAAATGPENGATAQSAPASPAQSSAEPPSALSQPAQSQPAQSQPAQPSPAQPAVSQQASPLPGPAIRTSTAPAASSRVRARLARLGGPRPGGPSPVLEPLFRIVRASDPKADLRTLERAYQMAEKYHRGQRRKSGDPYITHPVAVTTILAELGMDIPTLCAGLLHDTVEDTDYTLDMLRRDFGDTVALLVDGVTKLDKVKLGEAAQAETVRKMVVAMARDIRVLVIKLADRLHNMRTMRYMRREKQEQKSRETLEIYAPLAHRLGMNTIKWELEDLAFAILYPKMYDEIVHLVAERAPKREEFLAQVIDIVQGDLHGARIKATVTGRPKHYYSVYQKMIVRGRDFAEIYDLVGIRVLVESVRDCYAALGTIHARWNPVP